MARPILSDYPALHNVLRNDPVANQQFNQLLATQRSPPDNDSQQEELNTANTNLTKMIAEVERQKKILGKMYRFIRVLGTVIEPQVQIRPYVDDMITKADYIIKFNANQIRAALNLYWNIAGEDMEKLLGVHPDDSKDPAEDE